MNNPFDQALESYLGAENLRKIKPIKVGVAGAGGLGSNCAHYLVRSGFRHLVLADFDRVDYSNLSRQFYFPNQVGRPKVEALKDNLECINPAVVIEAVCEKLNPQSMERVFKDCRVVVEAFDNPLCKRELIEVFARSGKLLVAASGIAGWGGSDDIKVRRITGNFYLVGDMVSEVGKDCPPLSPRVNIVAAKQANVVLSCILDGIISIN